MISISITADAADARAFLVRIEGRIRNPKDLNDALGRRLARELQDHFRQRNAEPNKMGAAKTNFWADVAEATGMTEATAAGATVSVAEPRFRIHFYGGTIRPTGGRKWLTIPLIAEARGKRVADYEAQSGNKLFRLPGTRVLVERTDQGDRSLVGRSTGTVRRRAGGFRQVGISGRSQIRLVYALAAKVTHKKDPRAVPTQAQLVQALGDEADQWAARMNGETPGGTDS